MDRKILAALPAVAGVLLLPAASASRNSRGIRFIGLMGIIKGLIMLSDPGNLYDRFADRYFELQSDQVLLLGGISALILGTAVLS